MKPFGYKGQPGTCLWCGDRLRDHYGLGQGYMGRGYFDTLRCAWHFALRLAELGKRLEEK